MDNPNDNLPVNSTDEPVEDTNDHNGQHEGAVQSAPPVPPVPPEDPIRMDERLERLGGEPAPAITPEEFARLQKAGQVHIDERGRVRTARRGDAEAGVSLRKRRAWYNS